MYSHQSCMHLTEKFYSSSIDSETFNNSPLIPWPGDYKKVNYWLWIYYISLRQGTPLKTQCLPLCNNSSKPNLIFKDIRNIAGCLKDEWCIFNDAHNSNKNNFCLKLKVLTFLNTVFGNFRIFSTCSGLIPSSLQLTLSSSLYVSSCLSSSISMKSFSLRVRFWILTLSTSSSKR